MLIGLFYGIRREMGLPVHTTSKVCHSGKPANALWKSYPGFTCSMDGPISQVGKSFLRLWCVRELLSLNVGITWTLQRRRCVVFYCSEHLKHVDSCLSLKLYITKLASCVLKFSQSFGVLTLGSVHVNFLSPELIF